MTSFFNIREAGRAACSLPREHLVGQEELVSSSILDIWEVRNSWYRFRSWTSGRSGTAGVDFTLVHLGGLEKLVGAFLFIVG